MMSRVGDCRESRTSGGRQAAGSGSEAAAASDGERRHAAPAAGQEMRTGYAGHRGQCPPIWRTQWNQGADSRQSRARTARVGTDAQC